MQTYCSESCNYKGYEGVCTYKGVCVQKELQHVREEQNKLADLNYRKIYEVNGKVYTIKELSKLMGVSVDKLRDMLNKYGWNHVSLFILKAIYKGAINENVYPQIVRERNEEWRKHTLDVILEKGKKYEEQLNQYNNDLEDDFGNR